jgi:hypothetical protein
MKTYTVYINPKSKNPQEDAEFVPEGFSFLMFLPIINVAVAAYRRCWLLLTIIVAIELFTYFASESEFFNTHLFNHLIPWKLNMAIRLALLFFFGLWVNDFWRQKLEKRGYELAGIISVPSGFHSLSVAQQRFYDKLTIRN